MTHATFGTAPAKYVSAEGRPVYERYVTANGLRIRYLEWGTGFPLIMLSSLGAQSWAEQFLAAADTWGRVCKVYSIDKPGWGLSEHPKEYSYPMWVESIKGFADALKLEKFDLGGTSVGGQMAALFAHKYPERIRRLLLLTSPGNNPWGGGGEGGYENYRAPSRDAVRRNYAGLDPAIADPIYEYLQDEGRVMEFRKIAKYIGDPKVREEFGLAHRLPEMKMPILVCQRDDNRGIGGPGGVRYALEQFMLAPLGRLFVATGYDEYNLSGYNRYVNAFKEQVALFLTAHEIRPAK